MFNEYKQARKNNTDPNEYLNNVVNGFNPEQKQQWQSIMNGINVK